MREPTLTEALAERGYTHAPAGHYRHDIIDACGVVRFTGRAGDVWAWLGDMAQQQDAESDEDNRAFLRYCVLAGE